MRRAPGPRTRQRRLAALACLLWVLGIEVLPNVHVALHDRTAPHHHEGDPAEPTVTVHRHRVAHAHGGVAHTHGENAAAGRGLAVGGADAPVAPWSHGAHSLAHRGVALAAPAPIIVHPLPVDHRPLAIAFPVAQLVALRPPPDAAARAPPV